MRNLLITTVVTTMCFFVCPNFYGQTTESNSTSTFLVYKNELNFLQGNKYSKTQIEYFIREVFKDKADELVLKSDSRRLEIITEFLNRFEVMERPDLQGKNFQLLSTVALNNKYNSDLKMDTFYTPNNFNPLKYNFNMSSKEVLLYRIGNSNYIIRILPKN